MDVMGAYKDMLNRFNEKRELHQLAHDYLRRRDMRYNLWPLFFVQVINVILPQIPRAMPLLTQMDDEMATNIVSVITSGLAGISAAWVGFQAKQRYATRSEGHKNAASIYKHLKLMCTAEMDKVEMMGNDERRVKFLSFYKKACVLEEKAKEDDNMVPWRVKDQADKDSEAKKQQEGDKAKAKKTGESGQIENGQLVLATTPDESGENYA